MQHVEHVTVCRDCQAIAIPAGIPGTLLKGSEVVITQALGDSYTVNDNGRLLRVAGEDADALGKEPVAAPNRPLESGSQGKATHLAVEPEQIWDQLKTCYDPEIPINIVDLGLIYNMGEHQLIDGLRLITITMTLTAAGCGMGAILAEDIRQKLLTVPGVDLVDVELVYDPPWSREMMSDAAKLQLGML